MIGYLLQGLVIGLSAGISPGPLLALFAGRAMESGWKRTLPAAFAPLLSDGPIILLVLVVLVRVPEPVLAALRMAGGVFLLWLAYRMLRSLGVGAPPPDETASPDSLRAAVLVNLLNPNPYIFWSTVNGPILVAGWRLAPAWGLAFMVGFYGAMIAVYVLWIYLFGTAGRVRPGLRRLLTGIAGIGLAVFGVWQIFHR